MSSHTLRPLMLVAVLISLAGTMFAADDLTATPEQLKTAQDLEAIKTGETGPAVYDAWNRFCLAHFGAQKEPLAYKLYGDRLQIVDGGGWTHASRTSACIAWETNLPATTHVEYGLTDACGMKSGASERPFYVHVHTLKGLQPDATYHYRTVSVDERGNRVVSADGTFTTGVPEGAILFPADDAKLPFKLDRSGATYVLTRDLTAPDMAVETLGDDVTLDLDGHTVTFAQGGQGKAPNGIWVHGTQKNRIRYQSSKCRVLNGTVVQGDSVGMAGHKHGYGYNDISAVGEDFELAGVTVVYHAPESWGAIVSHPAGKINVHHNVFVDLGTVITNRHGMGVRPFGFVNGKKGVNAFRIHHNLVKRTRQNGLHGANAINHNEVWVDSWSTNSFALQPNSVPDTPAGELSFNRVFATGFNPYGFGWAHKDLRVHDNLVCMQGIDTRARWGERWGDIDMLAAMRVTNYGKGGQVRDNLQYRHNLIVLKGRGNSELRGVEFFSDETIKDLVFRDNTVKVISQDGKTDRVACVDTHGQPAKADTALPVVYRDCTFITNLCHVRFGDSYAIGSNHHFERCTFTRVGNDPRYHTFIFDHGYWSRHHVLLDCTFGPGTAYDDVFWQRTANTSWYAVAWTLTVHTVPGASVVITDADGKEVFRGNADAAGGVAVPLTQCEIHPVEWTPGAAVHEVKQRNKHQEVRKTPHTLTVEKDGRTATKTVEMTKPTTVEIAP